MAYFNVGSGQNVARSVARGDFLLIFWLDRDKMSRSSNGLILWVDSYWNHKNVKMFLILYLYIKKGNLYELFRMWKRNHFFKEKY